MKPKFLATVKSVSTSKKLTKNHKFYGHESQIIQELIKGGGFES